VNLVTAHEGEQLFHDRRTEFRQIDRIAAVEHHRVYDGRLKFAKNIIILV
jgi:hypothetical protein